LLVLMTSRCRIPRGYLSEQLGEETVPRLDASWFSSGRQSLSPAIWVMRMLALDYPRNALRMRCDLR